MSPPSVTRSHAVCTRHDILSLDIHSTYTRHPRTFNTLTWFERHYIQDIRWYSILTRTRTHTHTRICVSWWHDRHDIRWYSILVPCAYGMVECLLSEGLPYDMDPPYKTHLTLRQCTRDVTHLTLRALHVLAKETCVSSEKRPTHVKINTKETWCTRHGDTLHMETHYTWRHTTHGDTLHMETHCRHTTLHAAHYTYSMCLHYIDAHDSKHRTSYSTLQPTFPSPIPLFSSTHAYVLAYTHTYIHTPTCVGVYVTQTLPHAWVCMWNPRVVLECITCDWRVFFETYCFLDVVIETPMETHTDFVWMYCCMNVLYECIASDLKGPISDKLLWFEVVDMF